jgi:acyl dehydratase
MTDDDKDLAHCVVGQRWRSASRTLTEAELGLACMLSNDWHPLHADAHYAAASATGQRVFQGGYGVLIALGLATRFPTVGPRHALALGMDDWRFLAPLFIGDTVHVEVEITALRPTADGLRVVVKKQVSLVKSHGEVAQQGGTTSIVRLSPIDEHNDKENGDTQ